VGMRYCGFPAKGFPMNAKALFLASLVVAFSSSTARAEKTIHSLLLSNGQIILSSTAPVPSGSMLLVKNVSDGSLMAVPSELVANISKARAGGSALATTTIKVKNVGSPLPTSRLLTNTSSDTSAKSVIRLPVGEKVYRKLTEAKMAGTLTNAGATTTLGGGKSVTILGTSKAQATLTRSVSEARAAGFKSGTTIFLGPTGGSSAAATRVETTIITPRAGATTALARAPLAASVQDQIFVGDLPRLTPRSGLTAGMVTPTAGETTIGPNGFPVPATAAASELLIGPNGFPPTGAAAPTRALTPGGAALTSAVPVMVSAATAATAGAISVPSAATAAGATAPAAASPPR
jgi:hypothetical protein